MPVENTKSVLNLYENLEYEKIISKLLGISFGLKIDFRNMVIRRLFRYEEGCFYPPVGSYSKHIGNQFKGEKETEEDKEIVTYYLVGWDERMRTMKWYNKAKRLLKPLLEVKFGKYQDSKVVRYPADNNISPITVVYNKICCRTNDRMNRPKLENIKYLVSNSLINDVINTNDQNLVNRF